MGWGFAFKLHMIINYVGQIIAIKITKGILMMERLL